VSGAAYQASPTAERIAAEREEAKSLAAKAAAALEAASAAVATAAAEAALAAETALLAEAALAAEASAASEASSAAGESLPGALADASMQGQPPGAEPKETASAQSAATDQALRLADTSKQCPTWAASGECTRNPSYMASACALSCRLAQAQEASPVAASPPDEVSLFTASPPDEVSLLRANARRSR
jgi:hypothetical protein